MLKFSSSRECQTLILLVNCRSNYHSRKRAETDFQTKARVKVSKRKNHSSNEFNEGVGQCHGLLALLIDVNRALHASGDTTSIERRMMKFVAKMQGGLRPPSPARAVLRRAPLAATGGSHASTLRTLVKEKRPKEEEGRPPARAETPAAVPKK